MKHSCTLTKKNVGPPIGFFLLVSRHPGHVPQLEPPGDLLAGGEVEVAQLDGDGAQEAVLLQPVRPDGGLQGAAPHPVQRHPVLDLSEKEEEEKRKKKKKKKQNVEDSGKSK